MDIWALDKLVLLIFFVIPGFITLKAYGLLAATGHRESSQQVIDAVAYSCINYAILAFPISTLEASNLRVSAPYWYFGLWALFLLVMPVALAFAFWKLRSAEFFQKILPHPVGRPWDFFFAQRRQLWAVVTLKDGRKVGGLFGSKSFASSHPYAPELYLEDTWLVNAEDGLERIRSDTAGILIAGSDISTIEFFNPKWSSENERAQDVERRLQAVGSTGVSTVDADKSA
ncbi:MAG: hypothetical protein GX761_06875 [Gammaproteobacteria bacterium]|nr:hypothetical protein [Gammaproteobacteria bacterium]